MCPSLEPICQRGGLNISGTIGVVGGDIVAGDKIVHTLSKEEIARVVDELGLYSIRILDRLEL